MFDINQICQTYFDAEPHDIYIYILHNINSNQILSGFLSPDVGMSVAGAMILGRP